ncbi:MAG: DNA mismatch repair endonuclease MutL [Nitrospirae bacterium]|nr:DNA mismatch repair endonuclease MutL [Nitrospirota bacterium]
MSKIHILPENLCNKIAAGEIVERPASVVKELVENAIDAGATRIFIEAADSGRRLIRVSDNGEGMEPEDARKAFERHATSKLATEADLAAIRTMGFRGEALPSIAAVARVRMVTAQKGGAIGTEIRIHGGTVLPIKEAAAPAGTLIEVEDLFYNTPARKKFLKSNATELAHIVHTVQQQALPHPWIHFRLTHNDHLLLDFPIVRNVMERTSQVTGSDDAAGGDSDFVSVASDSGAESNGITLTGWFSKPGRFRATREHQEFFLNRRAIRNTSLSHAVNEAYGTLLAKGRHPMTYLFIEMDPASVDVNVHPAKREVRFRDTQAMHRFIKEALRERLRREGLPAVPAVSYVSDSGAASHVIKTGRPTFSDVKSLSGARPSSDPRWPEGTREAMAVYHPPEGEATSSDAAAARPATILWPIRIEPLGQVDQTYIVALVESELHLIDQHAAHERLLYERFRSQQKASEIPIQPLLIPEVVEFPTAEALRLREVLPLLGGLGLSVEEFGERSFRIRAAPAVLGVVDGRILLEDLLDDVGAGATPAAEETLQNVMASMACHAAIKAHQSLRPEQMTRLLEDLYRQEVPPTCPHGRPIRVRFSRADLEKLFQRR